MVIISEWLPNPVGKDAEGEWVELFNNGSHSVGLAGWRVEAGKSKFYLNGEIASGEYLLLKRQNTKLSLVNEDGKISLFDSSGKLVDSGSFFGLAAEGKSYSRVESGNYFPPKEDPPTAEENNFLLSDPTPATKNVFSNFLMESSPYIIGKPLNAQIDLWRGGALSLVVALIIAGLLVFLVQRNEDLQELFFGRDEEDC